MLILHYFGSYVGKAIAAEIDLSNQGNETNSKNVKFEVYLDENDKNVREKSASIDSEMKLCVSANVQGGGYLKDPVVELVDTNFRFKNNTEVTKFNLGSIQSNKGISVSVPIIAKKDESYKLNLLDMQSQIKLTGEYIDENGNVTDIDTTKAIKTTWTLDELTQDNISLNQEVITNKIYNLDGANKRIVQILVTSNVQGNSAPVKSSLIEVENPEIGMEPEKVKVAGYTTKATNGKTCLEFADGENSKWEYNSEEGKTYIQVLNNPNEDNVVTWAKNSEDKFVVTYIYDESVEMLPFISNVKSKTEIYGKTSGAIEKTNTITLEELDDIGDIVKLENKITNNIYKGKMYIGEDTNYKTASKIYVPYSESAGNIVLEDNDDQLEGISTYYKTTKINKADALKVLGQEGTIKVYNAEDRTTPIKEISLSEEIDEDYFVVSYDENVNKIVVEMSKAEAEGTIEIINDKAIKVSDTDIVSELKELKSNETLIVKDVNNNIMVNSSVESKAKLVEPKTKFDVSLDKTSISALSENNVRITADLISKDESNKLMVNPTISMELPKEITEASIESITPVVGSDELKIKAYNVATNDAGNKVIVIELEGEQTSYSSDTATVVIDTKLKTDAFMADKDVEIKSTIINDEDTAQKTNPISIVSKSGLVTKSTIKVGKNVTEKVNQTTVKVDAKENEQIDASTAIINNYEGDMSNQTIIGTIPEEAVLSSTVTTNIKEAKVYYSEEANPQANSDSWKTGAKKLDSIKSFKIETESDIKQGAEVAINYKYDIKAETAQESTIKISGTVDESAKQETLKLITNPDNTQEQTTEATKSGETTSAEKLSVQVIAVAGGKEVANNAEINNGQVLKYKVKVTNTSAETLNNVKLKATIKNGVFYDLVRDGSIIDYSVDENGDLIYPDGKPTYIYDEVKDSDNKEFAILKSLGAGETKEFEYQVVAYMGEGEDKNKFNNNILITADDMNDITIEDAKTIKEASLALKLKYGYNEEVKSYSSDSTEFMLEASNLTDSQLQNVNLKINLPEEFDCDTENQIYIDDDENVTISKNSNQINVMIKTIEQNSTQSIKVKLLTKDMPYDELERSVTLRMTGNVGTNSTEYVSNDYTLKLLQGKSHITANLISDKMGETLKEDDIITYTADIKNDGYVDVTDAYIEDKLPDELNVISAKVQYSDGTEEDAVLLEDDHIFTQVFIKAQDSVKLIIKAEVFTVPEDINSVSNKVTITGGRIHTAETEELVNKLTLESDLDNPEDPDNPNNPSNPENPTDPSNPNNPSDPSNPSSPTNPENPGDDENKEGTNSISGLAWLDENKDGVRNENEKVLQAIKVILLDKEGKEVSSVSTSLTGTYKFANIEQGEYTVVFEYDTSKYAVTKYQATSATEETNSDVISKQVEINGETKTAGITDTIKLAGKDVSNIDIGLITNAKFDLRLDKYVSKVVLTNDSGTSTYEYEDTNLAKVEISAKRIAGTVMMIEYDLKVTNEGDVDGYVGDVIDYLPDGLVFTSETNKDWYLDGSGMLHNKTLSEQVIKAGDTKTLTLVLTKTLKSDSTGTIDNIGEIGESSNLQGIKDFDSTAGNKQSGEDDINTASLIVSIATGSPIMYIGIVIGSVLVLGLGIYIIDKKVLEERI